MSPVFDFDSPVDRRASDSIKWRRYRRNPDILPMWVADMDFKSPPEVISALHERIDHAVFGYGDIPDSFQETVLRWLASEYDWAVDPTWLV